MVALLRHFLAGSLLLLAVFTSVVDAKAKCTQGGICAGKKSMDPKDYPYDSTFKPIECEDNCYRFYCFANGGINAGYGCKDAVEKHCPGQAYKMLNEKFETKSWFNNTEFAVSYCTDDSCQVASTEKFTEQYNWAKSFYAPLWDKIIVDACEYNPSPPPSSAAIGYDTSMVLLGSIVAGWILAVQLW